MNRVGLNRVGLSLCLCAALGGARSARAAGDAAPFEPATTNVRGAAYPRVDGASRVELRVKAPEATNQGLAKALSPGTRDRR